MREIIILFLFSRFEQSGKKKRSELNPRIDQLQTHIKLSKLLLCVSSKSLFFQYQNTSHVAEIQTQDLYKIC